jgi:hypothetical protein
MSTKSKKIILYSIGFIVGLISFILLYGYYSKANNVIWLGVVTNLMVSSIIAFVFYCIFGVILYKIDKKYANDVGEKNINDAVQFFQKHQTASGSYFASIYQKAPTLPSKIYSWIILTLVIGVALFYIILSQARNLQSNNFMWGIVFTIICIGGFLYSLYRINKGYNRIKVGEYKQFELYKDHFVLLPQNKTLNFSDIDYLQIFLIDNIHVMNIYFDHMSHYFILNNGSDLEDEAITAAYLMSYFIKYLGFKEKYQYSSEDNPVVKNNIKYIYNKTEQATDNQ